MNICIVAGARPNFIKVAPIVRAVENARAHGRDVSYTLVFAGAEDDPTLEPSLFQDLQIAPPQVYLNVVSENQVEITAQVMSAFDRYLQENQTDAVIVVDDLSSTMAASIVAKKHGIRLAHLVAGTRSFDINMPKEINRLVIDGLSDLLFTAGMGASSTAAREGAEQSKIYMVGNVLLDTLRFNQNRLRKPAFMEAYQEREYLVFTLNRKALLERRVNLFTMIQTMVKHAQEMPIIAPLRGETARVVEGMLPFMPYYQPHNFLVVPSLNYLEFGWLTAHAKGIITDSGNVAEEATFNGVPCITLNSYTEHIDTVKVGTNELVGEDAKLLGQMLQKMVHGQWKTGSLPARWDGRTAERIVQILMEG